jgi:hypothetical protein
VTFEEESSVVCKKRSGEVMGAAFRLRRVEDEAARVGLSPTVNRHVAEFGYPDIQVGLVPAYSTLGGPIP